MGCFDDQVSPKNLFDFTIPLDVIDKEEILEILQDWGKQWAFQHEISDDGYEHWQGRISLRKKRFGNALCKEFKPICKEWHWSLTSNNGLKTGMSYVIKKDTRVEGPWRDDDPEPKYIPCHVKGMTLRPFQQKIKDSTSVFQERWINVLLDTKTKIGKSRICAYLNAYEHALWIPPMSDYKELMQVVMCKIGKRRSNITLLFDIPKGIKHYDSRAMWNAIETIKTGFAFDTRYSYKEMQFDPPVVWVFTNTNPTEDIGLHREDVYKIWEVSADFDLVPWTNARDGSTAPQ